MSLFFEEVFCIFQFFVRPSWDYRIHARCPEQMLVFRAWNLKRDVSLCIVFYLFSTGHSHFFHILDLTGQSARVVSPRHVDLWSLR